MFKNGNLQVRKFKLELSEKQQQEVDVDLDVQCDDIGNQAPMVADVKPEVISTDALQVVVEISIPQLSQSFKNVIYLPDDIIYLYYIILCK